jgi:hypothetical protein
VHNFFKPRIVLVVKGDCLAFGVELHLNNSHLPKFVGGGVHHALVVRIKLWEDFFALLSDSVSRLAVVVKTDELYGSALEEQGEYFVRYVAVR